MKELSIKPYDIVCRLEDVGWEVERERELGTHYVLIKDEKTVTILKSNKPINEHVLDRILRQTGLKLDV
jgi:predicted RNA binding protein YcfA (HicA-like mRNA interferase family)